METKISIIIPAYNVAGYLEKCLDSLLVQTFPDFEIIVINDGSGDNTPVICDAYAAKDSRIKVIHKKNEGVSIARNTGFEAAVGEYILFFDGDDFVEPYTCEELYRTIKEQQVDTLIYGYHRYENGRIKVTSLPIFPEGVYEGGRITRELAPRFVGISYEGVNRWFRREENALYVENPALWRTMLSSRIIKENKLKFNKNLKVGEDTIFISEYLTYSQKCYVYHQCFYYLVTRETSTIYVYEKNPSAKLEGKLKLLDARLELTERVRKRTGFDLGPHWRGTVLMSCMEIAFLMARKHPEHHFMTRYRWFMDYIEKPEVKKTFKQFKLDLVPNVMVVPFIMLKWSMFPFLFAGMTLLQFMNYDFKRV